jgi:hypothetical protein
VTLLTAISRFESERGHRERKINTGGNNVRKYLVKFGSASVFSIAALLSVNAAIGQEGNLRINKIAQENENLSCVEWAKQASVDDRTIFTSIFTSKLLAGGYGTYQTLDRSSPQITNIRDSSPDAYSHTDFGPEGTLFDVAKNEYETSEAYLKRRFVIWSKILNKNGNSLFIPNKFIEFAYDADAQMMALQSNSLPIGMPGDVPAAKFAEYDASRGKSSYSKNYEYYILSNDDFVRQFSHDGKNHPKIMVSPDVAREIKNNGMIKLKLKSPIFDSANLPVAFERSTSLPEYRHIGFDRSLFVKVECAVLTTPSGKFFDLKALS